MPDCSHVASLLVRTFGSPPPLPPPCPPAPACPPPPNPPVVEAPACPPPPCVLLDPPAPPSSSLPSHPAAIGHTSNKHQAPSVAGSRISPPGSESTLSRRACTSTARSRSLLASLLHGSRQLLHRPKTGLRLGVVVKLVVPELDAAIDVVDPDRDAGPRLVRDALGALRFEIAEAVPAQHVCQRRELVRLDEAADLLLPDLRAVQR